MLIAREEAERQNEFRRLSEIKHRNAPSDKNISHGDLCYIYQDKGDYKGTNAGYTGLYIFIGKEGQTAHVLDGSTANSFSFSIIRPATAAQMHTNEQAERLRADGITAMVALRSGTAEYAPLRNSLSDRNYRQDNEQDNVQGNKEEYEVQGNTKEDNAQDIDDKNNYPTALNAILPRMTRSTTRAAVAASALASYIMYLLPKQSMPSTRRSADCLVAEHFLLCTSTQYLHTLISSVRVLSLA
jgi:hypothetical protein